MTLASGYGSNTFPYSAAHVLDSSTMLNEIHPINSNRVSQDQGLFNTPRVAPEYTHSTGSYIDSEKMKVSPSSDTFYMWPKSTFFTGNTLVVTPKANNSMPNSSCFT